MKTTQTLLLGAVAAALLTVTATGQAADFSVKDLSNRAIAASPRAKEQFPWLTRQSSATTASITRSDSVPANIRNNRALAVSPRMLEQYPQLARTGSLKPVTTTPTGNSEVAKVLKNRAYAASPRAIEQFPWLARTPKDSFEIAPLK